MGPGSGLNADKLDGFQASNFLQTSGLVRYNVNTTFDLSQGVRPSTFEIYQSAANKDAMMAFHIGGDFAGCFGLDGNINDFVIGGWSYGSTARYRVWHAGNDGSGSGLDADTVDGLQASSFARLNTWNSGNIHVNGQLHVRNNTSNHYSHIVMYDDQSVNGKKYVHANSNVIGFLGGDGSWLHYASDSGAIWSRNYGWLHSKFADRGAVCQRNSGIVEFGAIDSGTGASHVDLPNPYVMVGLRKPGGWLLYLRGVTLRNN